VNVHTRKSQVNRESQEAGLNLRFTIYDSRQMNKVPNDEVSDTTDDAITNKSR